MRPTRVLAYSRRAAGSHPPRHQPFRWYRQVAKVVLSRTLSGENLTNVTVVRENLAEQVGQIKRGPGGEILIFGSPGAAHSLMMEDLIDEYWLFVNPILLGQGIPVFADLRERVALRFIASHVFSSGVVCLHYARQESV